MKRHAFCSTEISGEAIKKWGKCENFPYLEKVSELSPFEISQPCIESSWKVSYDFNLVGCGEDEEYFFVRPFWSNATEFPSR